MPEKKNRALLDVLVVELIWNHFCIRQGKILLQLMDEEEEWAETDAGGRGKG